MLPGWTLIGLAAVFMWVIGTYFDKYLLEKYFSSDQESEDGGPGALIIFSSYFSFAVVIFAYIFGIQEISFSLSTGLLGMLIGILNGTWILMYLYALNRSTVEKVIPIFQLVPIFGLIFASVILGEFLLSKQIIAITILIFGALLILHYKRNSYLKIDTRTLGLMLGATALVALSETLFKFAALEANYWTAVFWTSAGFTLFGILLFFNVEKYRNEFSELLAVKTKHVMGANSANEVIDNSAELIFFFAITIGPIVLVQSLNAYQPLLALMFGLMLGLIFPKYFSEETKGNLLQKIFGILIITVASIYLYSII